MLDTVCDVLKESYRREWITTRDGNVSIRMHGQPWFHVTPSGTRKNLLNSDLLIKLSLPDLMRLWDKDEEQKFARGLSPTGELPMHHFLQRDHSGTRVVLHLHPTYTIAAMHKGVDLVQMAKEFPELRRYTRVGPSTPMIEPISIELANAVVKHIGLGADGSVQSDIIGLDRHGVVSIAADPWSAFEHVERLEHICKIYLS
jgi:ribulose-5-phosphate 4-epimerase/fuculose-1-phosphate aldolase